VAAGAAAARRGGPRAAVRRPAELRRVCVPLGGAVRRRRGRRHGQRDLTAAAGGSRAGCRLLCSASAVQLHLSSAAATPLCTGEGRQAATSWRACACGCVGSAPCRSRKLLWAGTPGAGRGLWGRPQTPATEVWRYQCGGLWSALALHRLFGSVSRRPRPFFSTFWAGVGSRTYAVALRGQGRPAARSGQGSFCS
jgi:hypothetical protein